MIFNWTRWKDLKTKIFYWLKEIDETKNLDILNLETYNYVIEQSKLAFGNCRYDFINLDKVDSFLKDNNWTLNDINRMFYNYKLLRKNNGCFKIIKQSNDKPDDYKYLSENKQKIYDDYQHLNNVYNQIFFTGREEKTKNIQNSYDKTEKLYVIIHHIREVDNIKNNNGWFVPNLSDLNIVLNKQFHQYQKKKELCRMDTFFHTFAHLIICNINNYSNTSLFKTIDIVIREKQRLFFEGYIISLDEFKNSDVKNYFTDYKELNYMINTYNLTELRLLQSAINILNNKLKDKKQWKK